MRAMYRLVAICFSCAVLAWPCQSQEAARLIKRERVVARAGSQFDVMDTNKNGTIDKAEMAAFIEAELAKARARLQRRFDEADTNKDGEISKLEFISSREKWFEAVDTNADGVLDQNELRSWNRLQRGK